MNRRRFLIALLLIDLALFAVTAVFLPRPSSFSYNTGNTVAYFIASRERWDIAWGVLISSLLLSGGIYLAVTSFNRTRQDDIA